MDAKTLLDELLKTGRDMAAKGQSAVEKKLDIEAPGEKRDATISGLKTGAIAAGVMALLVGTKSGRRLSGSALKLGSLAAVGGIAWQAYKNWSAAGAAEATANNDTKALEVLPVNKLDESAANDRSLTLLKAMIAAAKADGHINSAEMQDINQKVSDFGLSGDVEGFVQSEIATPTTPSELAALAVNPEIASEIYLISSMLIDKNNVTERAYLEKLVTALALPDDLLVELETAKDEAIALM